MLRLTLKLRLALLIAAVVAVLGVLIFQYLEYRLLAEMEAELEDRWMLMARYLAGEAVEPILYQDRLRLEQLMQRVQGADRDFTYSFVVDPSNRVLAHTLKGEFPESLRWLNQHHGSDVQIERVEVFGLKCRDFAVPIHGGELGTLRLGIWDRQITERLSDIRTWLLMLVLPVMLLGAAAAFLVVKHAMRPVDRIIEGLERFIPGRHREEIPVVRDDEIGDVARRINEITARQHRTQQSLLRTEKLASVGTMVAGVAHEINNPLTGLQNCLRRIEASPEDAAQTREYSGVMIESVNHMVRIVRTLLEFARRTPLEIRPVSLSAVIDKALKLIAFQLKDKEIAITVNRLNGAVEIQGDESGLVQVCVNLLLNSVDAMPDGGEVRITIGQEDNEALLRIHDEGSGIPADLLEQVFDPFFTTKEVGKGTGLGLAVTHRIIADHSGDLSIESSVGVGTEVTIRLPLGTATEVEP